MYAPHPAADLFPLLEGAEFDELVESIRKHGQLEQIELDNDNRILDGRNRYRACEVLGIEPRGYHKQLFDAHGQPIGAYEYVIAKNLQRRQLTVDQRAQIAAEALPHLAEEARARQEAQATRGSEGGRGHSKTLTPKSGEGFDQPKHAGEATAHAAKAVGVSRYKVEQAARIKQASPELAAKVKSGQVTAREAERQLPAAKREREALDRPKNAADVLMAMGETLRNLRSIANGDIAHGTWADQFFAVIDEINKKYGRT